MPEPEPPPIIDAVIRHIAHELTYAHTQHYLTENALDPPHLDFDQGIHHNTETKSINNTDILGEETQHDLPLTKVLHNRLTTIRLMSTAASTLTTPAYRLHIDGGANRSITPFKHHLLHFRNIKAYPILGVNKDDPALTVSGMGYLPWCAPDGTVILIKCLYSAQAADTIVSPTDVVLNHQSQYTAWAQHSDVKKRTGYIDFIGPSSHRVRFPLIEENGLWFYHNHQHDDYHVVGLNDKPIQHLPLIQRLNAVGAYELIHARLGHPGTTTMTNLHLHVDGAPKLRPHPFYKCETCLKVKATKHAVTTAEVTKALNQAYSTVTTTTMDQQPQDQTSTQHVQEPTCLAGEQFHMDMGFVRGTQFSYRDGDGTLVTSLDGFNSYLIIVDKATRYSWVFLARSKHPPIEIIKNFLNMHGSKTGTHKYIRTDAGGELWSSHAFQKMAYDMGYIPQVTAADASFQNGIAERPNRTLGDMMRALLHGANLGPEYWSWALLHAVYLKNRTPHRAIHTTPIQAYTGKRPDISGLRVFGSPIIARLPGRRPAKLDAHTTRGIFLGFTATDKNIYYRDSTSGKIKIGTHITFDEAGFTLPKQSITPTQRALQDAGHIDTPLHTTQGQQHIEPQGPAEDTLLVQLLSDNARMPVRSTPHSAGLDLFSAISTTIKPHSQSTIPTDIAICPPIGTYCQILSRSGLIVKNQVETKAGTIDRDYRGNVLVVLANTSNEPFHIQHGDRIAQLVTYYIASPTPTSVATLSDTLRGTNGFGSTGVAAVTPSSAPFMESVDPSKESTSTPISAPIMAPNPTILPTVCNIHDLTQSIIQQDGIMPYNIWLSQDPFQSRISVQIDVKGDHDTLGLKCEPTPHGRLQLIDMHPGTPSIKLPRWKSTLRRSLLLTVDGTPVSTVKELQDAVTQARQQQRIKVTCEFATITSPASHPAEGSLHLYYDQLNVIGKHLKAIKTDHQPTIAAAIHQHGENTPIQPEPTTTPIPPEATATSSTTMQDPDLGKFLTWKEIKRRPDLPEWKRSRYKMLDDYHNQGMFSEPMPRPANANIHHMLWRYFMKMDGTRKARMVCDGSARQGTITLGHTYANSLMAASERLFWALSATHGLLAYGADVTNAFAEAPPPVHPLYMHIDDAFREWWTEHLQRAPIPSDCTVVQVHNAIQGHPESPRLWEKHIDRILKKIGFRPTTHEPCLYRGTFQGHITFFLRQVDDFAISTISETQADQIIQGINQHLHIPMKRLGLIQRFNGVDIEQTGTYIKLHCAKYLTKMLTDHQWLTTEPLPIMPVPFPADKTYTKHLQECNPPQTHAERQQLEKDMGFKYRQVMGEIMFPMVKCRPDISSHVIYLSQYLDNPSLKHYQALRDVARYLSATLDRGIHYWRRTPHLALPLKPEPIPHADNYTLKQLPNKNANTLVAYVDSDWASNGRKRNSLTGMVLILAGGVIGYKTKFQPVIAHSSTEAEFIAACDTAKMILFFRSILEELGIEQQEATVLYEDNTGALMMANAQQPTKRTRHIEIKHFALLDWVEQDLVTLHSISTHDNAADAMTKPLSKQLFYRHMDTYMGYRKPEYVQTSENPGITSKNGTSSCPTRSTDSRTVRTMGGV